MKCEILRDPDKLEMATKEQILVAIVLWVEEFPKGLYQ